MLDHTDRTAPTRRHELDHTDLPEISRSSRRDRSSVGDLWDVWILLPLGNTIYEPYRSSLNYLDHHQVGIDDLLDVWIFVTVASLLVCVGWRIVDVDRQSSIRGDIIRPAELDRKRSLLEYVRGRRKLEARIIRSQYELDPPPPPPPVHAPETTAALFSKPDQDAGR